MAEYVCEVVTEHELCGDVHHYARNERVTRCRDCKHSTSMGYQCEWFHGDYLTHAQVVPDGFCAWGEPIAKRGCPEKPTVKQLRFISDMQDELGVRFDGSTKAEASKWIDAHIEAYKLATADPFSIEHGYF